MGDLWLGFVLADDWLVGELGTDLLCWVSINHQIEFSTVQHSFDYFYEVRSKVEKFQTFVDEFMVDAVKSL